LRLSVVASAPHFAGGTGMTRHLSEPQSLRASRLARSWVCSFQLNP
jgi:hypothetical protein